MSENMLVFHNAETQVDELIEQSLKNPLQLDSCAVKILEPGQSTGNQTWNPQLPQHRPWTETEDLLVDKSELSGRKADLFSAGVLWMNEFDELLERAAKSRVQEPSISAQSCTKEELSDAIGVRQVEGGCALVSFDLRRLAEEVGSKEDLVVVLPATIGDMPLVRVAPDAFSRRLVQGVHVRLLVVPDTVTYVGANAFAAMCVQRIHLGCKVEYLGEQRFDLTAISPKNECREYSVDQHNQSYSSRDGNLFSNGSCDLLFLASPYNERVKLPDNIERIAGAAFANGCKPPLMVDCPATLARVDDKSWDDSVWCFSSNSPAHDILDKRDVRLASQHVVEYKGCWYDLGGKDATLVLGPPPPASASRRFAENAAQRAAHAHELPEKMAQERASRRNLPVYTSIPQPPPLPPTGTLALPREIDARPLVRIGVRALLFAPETLLVPDTVRIIERENACRGTKRLVLPEGLRSIGRHCFYSRMLEGIVSIPASVKQVGEGSFEYALCRLEHTGSVIHTSTDQLLSCFLTDSTKGVPFDFARYDELLLSGKTLPDRLGALLHRIAVPQCLSDEVRDALVAHLNNNKREAQERVAREGSMIMVAALVKAGFIELDSFDRQIELLRAANRTDCVAYLMDWRRELRETERTGGEPAKARSRFAL